MRFVPCTILPVSYTDISWILYHSYNSALYMQLDYRRCFPEPSVWPCFMTSRMSLRKRLTPRGGYQDGV